MGVDYRMIVEADEYSKYLDHVRRDRLLVVPEQYHDDYDTCDDLGRTKSQGPGPARNYAWDHSIELGYKEHWVMDDNIDGWMRINHNQKTYCGDGTILRVMEDFANRYENVVMSGPTYDYFVPRKRKLAPWIPNTRIYSCNLIRNDIPFRWRARYNEDTDLSLRILKAGLCTIEYQCLVQCKAPTQTVKGGNDKEFYSREGTLPKSLMQVKLHPDVSVLKWKFGRWHHYVDYNRFKFRNALILKPEFRKLAAKPNEYGMVIRDKRPIVEVA